MNGTMMRPCRLCAALVAAAVAAPACAQTPTPPRRARSKAGMGQSKDQPVQIEAATLEVHDKNKTATFSGNVQVVQGDTTMKCQASSSFMARKSALAPTAHPRNGRRREVHARHAEGAQNIRRIEARGGVTVLTKDQNASGDLGVYDLKTKTITLSGNVVVSQGQNVIHGERVVVDTVTGNARVESGSSEAAAAPRPVRAASAR